MRRRLVAAVVASALAFATVTLVALEGREVVVVETAAGAATHRTRTWIADDEDGAWIEAANPERAFVADLRRAPTLVLERGGVRRTCRAELVPNPGGHEHVRRLLRDRYGWADCWIGLLADTRTSLAVRVRCA